jgi:arabinose-5-phosphate isomerase
MLDQQAIIASGLRTLRMEADAVEALAPHIDDQFVRACQALLGVEGRVIVTGMGKSGHIGNKIAATLASTGTPAFFVHPAEASHGDMGMITRRDAVLALSNSGTTPEILTLIPLLKRLGVTLVSLTGNPSSTLAQASDIHLYAGADSEACPLDLAPTSSTTAALVMGDALAIALLECRGFSAEDFAFSHPGGALGRKLLLKVEDVMVRGEAIPAVSPAASLADALMEITAKGLGMTTVLEDNVLSGIFTDGDLRRALEGQPNIHSVRIAEIMSSKAKTISSGMLAAEALGIMEQHKISTLVVVDETQKVEGVVHLLALLKAGIA